MPTEHDLGRERLTEIALRGRGPVDELKRRSIDSGVLKAIADGSCPQTRNIGCVLCDHSGVSCEEVSEVIKGEQS